MIGMGRRSSKVDLRGTCSSHVKPCILSSILIFRNYKGDPVRLAQVSTRPICRVLDKTLTLRILRSQLNDLVSEQHNVKY